MDRFADELFEKKLKTIEGGIDGEDDEDIYGDDGKQ